MRGIGRKLLRQPDFANQAKHVAADAFVLRPSEAEAATILLPKIVPLVGVFRQCNSMCSEGFEKTSSASELEILESRSNREGPDFSRAVNAAESPLASAAEVRRLRKEDTISTLHISAHCQQLANGVRFVAGRR